MGKRTKLSDIDSRPPEAGRLRFGIKADTRNGKQRPMAIDRWRMTSPERAQIEAIAALYGGTPEPWNEPRATVQDQWQVTTDTNRLPVWMPPGSLNVSYEAWNAGGCERRCDGETCWLTTRTHREQVPCVCATEQGNPVCKPHSRLSVMIPEIPFSGVWRLDTGSENFLYEAPGVIRMIEQMQAADRIVKVELLLTKRTTRRGGQTSHFVVPQIVLGQSPEQILVGHAGIGQLAEGARPLALGSGFVEAEPQVMDPVWHGTDVDDDEIIDAEVVEDAGPDGWDDRSEIPPDVRVVRNFGAGKRWVKAE